MSDLRVLLAASRPLSWVNTALPFAAAAYGALGDVSPALVLGTLWFLLPYNLLLYGVNDLYDYASDVANPRKGSLEGARVPPSAARRMAWAIGITCLPLGLVLAWLGGVAVALALAVTAFVAWAYSAPPLRAKERPVLDSLTSAMHFVLPAVCGLFVGGLSLAELPFGLLLAFTAWGMASHAVGAVQDIAYDRGAGVSSVATELGARGAALLALAGYALAVGLVALHGGPGILAAVFISAYLILPAMLLADPSERQARLAWQGFLGLDLVVGFALAQLLLRMWGITEYSLNELLVALGLIPAAIVLANMLLSLLLVKRAPAPARDDVAGDVTLVLPCRDDAVRLLAVLPALVGQRHPRVRVVVADAASRDGSAAAAARLMGERGSVLAAGEPPAGWRPAAWAGWQAAQASDTEWLLFTDTRTTLDPHATGALLAAAQARRADLASALPGRSLGDRSERILAPGFRLLLLGYLPLWLVAHTAGRPRALAYAGGHLLLVRREAYLAVGGHAALRRSGRPDIDLVRAVVGAGRRAALVNGVDLCAMRQASSLDDAAGEWRARLLSYAGDSLAMAGSAIIGSWLAWGLPMVLPVVGLLAGDVGLLAGGIAALAVMALARVLAALVSGEEVRDLAWHPVTAMVTPALQVWGLGAALLRPAGGRRRESDGTLVPASTHPSGPRSR